ncbi:hypothetical protein FACS1894166_05750 [Bacilli bacterium]|nr:hypothetical protein FACS1894166_05750 [Bacilli bacterium]
MIEDLENLKQHCKIIPTVNQVEFHPGDHFYDQLQLYCKKYNILIMAYAPIARNKLNAHPILQIIAHKYHKSVAQICIR